MELILASTSPYRRALLDRIRAPYRAVAHQCDERAVQAPDLEALAQRLARAKAESLASQFPDALILGSDQIAALGQEQLHKPGTVEGAAEQLQRLQGRAHRLITAAALRHPDGSVEEVLDVHEMHMRPLGRDEIERYVELERPLDCCGAYKIEGLGVTLFERVLGDDPTAIIGLPLMSVSAMLRSAGLSV